MASAMAWPYAAVFTAASAMVGRDVRRAHSIDALAQSACVRATVRACVRAASQCVLVLLVCCVCGVHLHVRTDRSSMGWPHRSTTSCSRKVAASCESAERGA